MILKTAYLGRYRKGDTIQYISNLLDLLTDDLAARLTITSERRQLNDAFTLLTSKAPEKRSRFTAPIANTNKQRTAVYVGLKHTVEAWAKNHYTTAKKQAALDVVKRLKSYGKRVDLLHYQEKTATLNAIIHDLKTVLASQVALLNLNEWVTELEELNSRFDLLFLQRVNEKATQHKSVYKDTKDEVITALTTLKTVFEARQLIASKDTPELRPVFKQLTQQWNALTLQYNTSVTRPKSYIKTPDSDQNTSYNTEEHNAQQTITTNKLYVVSKPKKILVNIPKEKDENSNSDQDLMDKCVLDLRTPRLLNELNANFNLNPEGIEDDDGL